MYLERETIEYIIRNYYMPSTTEGSVGLLVKLAKKALMETNYWLANFLCEDLYIFSLF